ncbi:MAG: GMP synthase subunit A [Candidatus Methanolliviera hydrocarbonicum]|uniref:GMP synthase [glutamine-hydrolyzing] subunit A n=1 Tax=Candidatus Methanolliviera hydrocarbonicum TaxID=2491085 RepID=A0A520KWU9_9EURY|nr:MAG: GMP synthase subunit A [Candidatus Methanolliviera hydrocarbonicum]
MNILIIDNHGQYCHLIHRSLGDLGVGNRIVENDISIEELLSEDPDGIILSGGPTLERSGRSQSYLEEIDLPFLGICLGHQIIANTFGGSVRRGKEEYAEVEVEILDGDDIFMDMPNKIKVWSSHGDEVVEISPMLKRLARSDICEYEAIRHRERPIFGVQWHPEVYHTERGEKIFKNFVEICRG